jgi:hypothetical protein
MGPPVFEGNFAGFTTAPQAIDIAIVSDTKG